MNIDDIMQSIGRMKVRGEAPDSIAFTSESALRDFMTAARKKLHENGVQPDALIIAPQMFDPHKPYHGGGTNRMRKRARFRSHKRAEFYRAQLKAVSE